MKLVNKLDSSNSMIWINNCAILGYIMFRIWSFPTQRTSAKFRHRGGPCEKQANAGFLWCVEALILAYCTDEFHSC